MYPIALKRKISMKVFILNVYNASFSNNVFFSAATARYMWNCNTTTKVARLHLKFSLIRTIFWG